MEELTDNQIERYARHLVLPEIDEEGQAKLLVAKVLIIGAGGLGSPLLMYLAAAGVGTLYIADDDEVDLSNLQRQIAHGTNDIGKPKVRSASETISALNPEISTVEIKEKITAGNAAHWIEQVDIVADGSDNLATRQLMNDVCFKLKKPLISAAITRFDGQLTTFKAYEPGENRPCYRCLFPSTEEVEGRSCSDVGVLATLPGVMGSLQATEVIKEITGIGTSLVGELVIYDALDVRFSRFKVKRADRCEVCVK
ncbi:molybdopterin-synthase adenylyltransferase MoeB [Alphaproteobacteria bacterium]|nr:molybdopterin-synthase adenylyltransferase MoeB [Alphaproteobacteria bacterium]